MNFLQCLEGLGKSLTHMVVAYFIEVYNTTILSTFNVLLGAVHRIVILSFIAKLPKCKLSRFIFLIAGILYHFCKKINGFNQNFTCYSPCSIM